MNKSSGFWGIPLKVAFGYVVLLAVSAFAVVLVWDYSRSAVRLTDVARRTDIRHEAMNGLVHGILRMENAERAIFMGHAGRGDDYCRLTDSVIARADSLAALLSDTLQRRRVDTLRTLLMSKRENTLLLLKAMNDGSRASLYERKAARLRSGRDSMVVHKNMARHSWPGNLRELKNVVRRAALLTQSGVVDRQHLEQAMNAMTVPLQDISATVAAPSVAPTTTPIAPLHDAGTEAEQIRHALQATNGNKSLAARMLGIDRKTLYNKLEKYGISV